MNQKIQSDPKLLFSGHVENFIKNISNSIHPSQNKNWN